MPQVYMVTVGPGSNGTTSWRAVSYKRRGMLGIEPRETDGGPRLVADVDLQDHGGEGLDGRRCRKGAGVHRAQTGNLGDQLGRGRRRVGVVGTDEDVTLEGVVEIAERVSRQ